MFWGCSSNRESARLARGRLSVRIRSPPPGLEPQTSNGLFGVYGFGWSGRVPLHWRPVGPLLDRLTGKIRLRCPSLKDSWILDESLVLERGVVRMDEKDGRDTPAAALLLVLMGLLLVVWPSEILVLAPVEGCTFMASREAAHWRGKSPPRRTSILITARGTAIAALIFFQMSRDGNFARTVYP